MRTGWHMARHGAWIPLLTLAVWMPAMALDPVQSVDWFKAHEVERKSMIESCKAHQSSFSASLNCRNAARAALSIAWRERKERRADKSKSGPQSPVQGLDAPRYQDPP